MADPPLKIFKQLNAQSVIIKIIFLEAKNILKNSFRNIQSSQDFFVYLETIGMFFDYLIINNKYSYE